MSEPRALIAVHFTLDLGEPACLTFTMDEMLPGAHYSVSRNFNSPPRKPVKGEPKAISETWLAHNIHFLTDRETKEEWQKRTGADAVG